MATPPRSSRRAWRAGARAGHQVYSHWKFPFDPRFSAPMKGTGNGGEEA